MGLEERAARAAALANKPTRADRLTALVRKLNPAAAALFDRDGTWKIDPPPPWIDPNQPGAEANAPYVIRERDDGTVQIQLVSEEGDVVGAVGDTLEAALARLEEKTA